MSVLFCLQKDQTKCLVTSPIVIYLQMTGWLFDWSKWDIISFYLGACKVKNEMKWRLIPQKPQYNSQAPNIWQLVAFYFKKLQANSCTLARSSTHVAKCCQLVCAMKTELHLSLSAKNRTKGHKVSVCFLQLISKVMQIYHLKHILQSVENC